MAKEQSFFWFREPKFNIGQKVYGVFRGNGFGRFHEDEVLRFSITLFTDFHKTKDEGLPIGTLWAVPDYYILNAIGDFHSFAGGWLEKDLYPTQEEAEIASEWIPCDLPDEIWLNAIGRGLEGEDSDEELDNMDFPPGCCGTTGYIRSALFAVKSSKGMIRADRDRLQATMNTHEGISGEHLDQILNQLGLNWVDSPHSKINEENV